MGMAASSDRSRTLGWVPGEGLATDEHGFTRISEPVWSGLNPQLLFATDVRDFSDLLRQGGLGGAGGAERGGRIDGPALRALEEARHRPSFLLVARPEAEIHGGYMRKSIHKEGDIAIGTWPTPEK